MPSLDSMPKLVDPDLVEVLPFVRQWYAGQSEFVWFDQEGAPHRIFQGDGGEQGDALMPALFRLALRRALSEVQVCPRAVQCWPTATTSMSSVHTPTLQNVMKLSAASCSALVTLM